MYSNLRAELARRNMSIFDLSKETGISKAKMYSRVKGETDFTLNEALKIADTLGQKNLTYLFAND